MVVRENALAVVTKLRPWHRGGELPLKPMEVVGRKNVRERVDFSHHNHVMNLSTLVLILAFVVFVAAAIGWKWRKTDLIAIGLALLVLAQLIGAVHIG